MIDGWAVLDGLIYLVALVALTRGGNVFTRCLLSLSGINPPPSTPAASRGAPAQPSSTAAVPATTAVAPRPATSAKAGRMIGSLERLIILIGLVAGSWEIMAAVIALKTVGRFKELDERIHAEYFLIGSLASVVWAASVSLFLIWFDRHFGFELTTLIQPAKG